VAVRGLTPPARVVSPCGLRIEFGRREHRRGGCDARRKAGERRRGAGREWRGPFPPSCLYTRYMSELGEWSAAVACPSCRYDLAGLDGVGACPECGRALGELDWEMLRRANKFPPPRAKAIALILAPHVSFQPLFFGLFMGMEIFPGRDMPPTLMLIMMIAYAVTSPWCAATGVHWYTRQARTRRTHWVAALLGAVAFSVSAITIFAMAPMLGSPRY